MSKKNVIEVWYSTQEYEYNMIATRSVTRWPGGTIGPDISAWIIGEADRTIYDRDDIDAFRKLLDAIEAELPEKRVKSA